MARYKTGILLITALIFLAPAASFTFDVSIIDITDASVKDVQYAENVSLIQNINASIENTGSIGCGYRLKTEYRAGNKTFERYSEEKQLWQGATSRAKVMMLTSNYTGKVTGNLTAEFCGQSKQVQSFNYSTANVTLPEPVEARTTRSTADFAQVRIRDYQSGVLVPVEAPPYWKTSSAQLEDGRAELSYEAPIFDRDETITYALIQNQSVETTVNVSMEENPTFLQKVLAVDQKTLYTLLILLALLNIAQILRTRRNKD